MAAGGGHRRRPRRRPRSLWLAHPPSQSTHCARDNPSAARAPGVRVMFRVGSVILRGIACLGRACACFPDLLCAAATGRARGVGGAPGGRRG